MRKIYIIARVFVLSISLMGFALIRMNEKIKANHYEELVHKTAGGYGYNITYNKKVLIKQDYIPVIQNVQSFCSYEDALKVATLVKEKLNKRENPKISLIDLNQLKIKLNGIH